MFSVHFRGPSCPPVRHERVEPRHARAEELESCGPVDDFSRAAARCQYLSSSACDGAFAASKRESKKKTKKETVPAPRGSRRWWGGRCFWATRRKETTEMPEMHRNARGAAAALQARTQEKKRRLSGMGVGVRHAPCPCRRSGKRTRTCRPRMCHTLVNSPKTRVAELLLCTHMQVQYRSRLGARPVWGSGPHGMALLGWCGQRETESASLGTLIPEPQKTARIRRRPGVFCYWLWSQSRLFLTVGGWHAGIVLAWVLLMERDPW